MVEVAITSSRSPGCPGRTHRTCSSELRIASNQPRRGRNIRIELHGPDCRETFFQALAGYDYEWETSGELTLCKNLRLKNAVH
ncbi:MAG: hypothetical protein ACP5FH_02910 [Terracidiphilus sp.]